MASQLQWSSAPLALRFRGGGVAVNAALVSVSANALGLMLYGAAKHALALDRRRGSRQVNYLMMTALEAALCGFAAYFVVYLLCGFVPMGFVEGSKPIFQLPTTPS